MEALLEPLLESPKLSLYVEQLQRILEEERVRREAFRDSITPEEKAEFINGEIVYHSPVKIEHNEAGKLLLMLLNVYVVKHQRGFVGYEKLMISLTRNDYEPDICFFGTEKTKQFAPKQMQFPAPDMIIEVLSASTEKIDRGVKMEDYAAHGVQEYWLVDTERRQVEQYHLRGDQFELSQRVQEGALQCAVVQGFAIPLRAVFEEAENMKALQTILSA